MALPARADHAADEPSVDQLPFFVLGSPKRHVVRRSTLHLIHELNRINAVGSLLPELCKEVVFANVTVLAVIEVSQIRYYGLGALRPKLGS